MRSGLGGSCETEEVSSACFQEPLLPPPRHGFSLEDYMSPECALMSVEFFFLERTSSSRRVTADKLCVWRCVVAVMCRATATVKECLWCWLV